ncbi:MAG: hypothetical protein HY721_06455 [Planctomycetes bacterium]|nr:hypothetical protein [Planctomycetota bacterium]
MNQAGVLDKSVRRIPASPEATARAEKDTYGTVKLLRDLDGDGRMDRSTVWADRLPPCYGLVEALDGVIVLCAPDIAYLADRDSDGEAEVREVLFTGFGAGELWTRINSPRWGLDGWIYAAPGHGSDGAIRGPRLRGEVRLGSTCFRFKPDGSAPRGPLPERGGAAGPPPRPLRAPEARRPRARDRRGSLAGRPLRRPDARLAPRRGLGRRSACPPREGARAHR